MSNSKLLIVVLLGCVALFGVWYFFIDTLSFSEIVGKGNKPRTTILINLFDFDTGLSRYDIYNLKSKSDYWATRTRNVNSISDPNRRNIENEKLMAEMMQDPSMKKIAKKVFGFGSKTALSVLNAIGSFY
jgi:hypothetical protein